MRTWISPAYGLLAFIVVVSGGLSAPRAAAQEDMAREHFRRGEAAYQQGNYGLAVEEWERAYAQDARPRIQYNIYQAYERLGKLGEAAQALQRYLSTADPGDPNYGDATARMASLQQRLQATGVRIVGGVEGASINVSGHDWGRLPRPDRIPVQPGNHRIVIQLEGYQDFVSNVVVPAGQVVDVPVELEKIDGGAPATPQPPLGTDPQTDAGGSVGGSLGPSDTGDDATPFFIASAALGAGTVGSLIWMLNRSGELDGCDDRDMFCTEEDTVSTQRNIALGLTAVLGAAAVGTLIYAVILGSEDDDQSASATRCSAGPLAAQCTLHF